jgi:hypothetical protein
LLKTLPLVAFFCINVFVAQSDKTQYLQGFQRFLNVIKCGGKSP